MSRDYRHCPKCAEYGEARMGALVPVLAARRAVTGETAEAILDRFMSGVHDRHLAGKPILPRPSRIAGRYAAVMAQIAGAS